MSIEDKRDSWIHYNMALIGGFLGTYGILTRSGTFPSAQTSNMISMVTLVIGRQPGEFLLRLGALAIYVGAIGLCTWLPKHSSLPLRELSLAIDSVAALVMTLIPLTAEPFLALYPLFFATAFQWCCFKGARGFTCATIFSTNNLRQFSSAAVEVWLNHDSSFMDKFRFFGGTLLFFHTGAAAAVLLSLSFGVKSALFAFIPIGAAWIQVEFAAHRLTAQQTRTAA